MKSRLVCTLSDNDQNPLFDLEAQLRWLVPADLYAAAWVHPSPEMLMKLFEHLRTLQHVLIDYVPRDVCDSPPEPGQQRCIAGKKAPYYLLT
jgi:adenylate cyclase